MTEGNGTPPAITSRGDYWPSGTGRGKHQRAARYGVLETGGHPIGRAHETTMRYITEYLVVDLLDCARVVKRFKATGLPGTEAVRRKRDLACRWADDLNFMDRIYDQ